MTFTVVTNPYPRQGLVAPIAPPDIDQLIRELLARQ